MDIILRESPQVPHTMIVVTANWEIGDGSVWPTPAAGTMARFRTEVARAAVRAGWRSDGRYDPVPRVEIVFAGDTFDWLGSRAWHGAVRPWQRSGQARAIREGVVARSLQAGGGIVRGMLALLRHGLQVPCADRHGRPVPGEVQSVPIGLTILEGNLDVGLTREPARKSAERSGIRLGTAWDTHGVRVVHGHGSDPVWGEDVGKGVAPSLGASLRVDLLGRFAASEPVSVVEGGARRHLLALFRTTHPLGLAKAIAAWIATRRDRAMASRVRDEWLRRVSAWHRAARGTGLNFAGRWSDGSFDVLDALACRLSAIDGGGPWRRPEVGPADLLGDLLGSVPPTPAPGIVILGHAPIDMEPRAGIGRCIGLGARQAPACDHDGQPPGVREIILRPPTPPFPTTAVVIDRGNGPCIFGLGDTVTEWSDTDRRGSHQKAPVDDGAWIVEAA